MTNHQLVRVGAIPTTRINDSNYALKWIEKSKVHKPTQTILGKFEIRLPLDIVQCTETEAIEFMTMFHYLPEHKVIARRICHKITDSNNKSVAILIRSNATGSSRGSYLWRKIFHYFMYNREEFMEHYHKRSNVETTFHMIKSKFGTNLRSKTRVSQINEVLCKILCHNICVLIQEMHELNFINGNE